MNRRSLLKLTGQAAIGIVAARTVVGRDVKAGSLATHPAIQANIDYWMQFGDHLRRSPPFHTSYYVVTEGEIRCVYAVKWNGPNLNDHKVLLAHNQGQMIKKADTQCGQVHKILLEDPMLVRSPNGQHPLTVDCYVYDSPVRRDKRWQVSLAKSCIQYGLKFSL